jgi:hypothetical protein
MRRSPAALVVVHKEILVQLCITANSPLPQLCAFLHKTGFNWGYGGSGPAQLALAILADALGDDKAQCCYQDFKWQVLSIISDDQWQLTEAEVRQWYRQFRQWKKP